MCRQTMEGMQFKHHKDHQVEQMLVQTLPPPWSGHQDAGVLLPFPHQGQNEPNQPARNKAGINLLVRLTDVLERMRDGSAQRYVFKAPEYWTG